MTVYYPCPVCGADVDDDKEWIKKHPIKRCSLGQPYHEKCGYESHLDFCTSPDLCENIDDQHENSILAECKKIAEERYDGHFTLMKFTTNWRFCFGTVECRDDISKMAEGKTMYEAIKKGIDRGISA